MGRARCKVGREKMERRMVKGGELERRLKRGGGLYLIANDSEKMPVFVGGGGGGHCVIFNLSTARNWKEEWEGGKGGREVRW